MIEEQFTKLILLLGGGQLILTALVTFTGKMWLSYLNEKQKGEVNKEIEKLKAILDKQVHVHKLQFETELKIYQEIWSILVEVRKATAKLRPIVDSFDPNETEDERKHRRLTEFGNAFQKFIDQVNKERPFYPEEIYSKLRDLIGIVREEAIDYEYSKPRDKGYWKKAEENSEVINQHIDEICEAIRQRIKNMSAV